MCIRDRKLGRAPTDIEIAEHLDFTKRTVQGLKLADLKTFSLHDPIQKGEEGSFEDIIPDSSACTPDEIIEDSESIQRLRGLIHNLDEREKTILVMRYGLDGSRPKTLEEVSRIIGRTRERVRQIQMQSLKKLRVMIEDETYDNDGNRQENDGNRQEEEIADPMPILPPLNVNKAGVQRAARNRSRGPRTGDPIVGIKLQREHNGKLGATKSSLDALKISTRSLNSLRSAGIETIAELAIKSPQDLLDIRFFGEKCLNEVQAALNEHYK